MNAIGASQISPKRAGSLLNSLQMASQNVDPSGSAALEETVVHCITPAENGEELGPECEASGPSQCGKCVEFEHYPVTRVRAKATTAGQSGKPMRTLPEMFKDAFWQNLTGLSRERYEMFREMNSKPEEPVREVSLVSLLKS
jgi:hypothetical protein